MPAYHDLKALARVCAGGRLRAAFQVTNFNYTTNADRIDVTRFESDLDTCGLVYDPGLAGVLTTGVTFTGRPLTSDWLPTVLRHDSVAKTLLLDRADGACLTFHGCYDTDLAVLPPRHAPAATLAFVCRGMPGVVESTSDLHPFYPLPAPPDPAQVAAFERLLLFGPWLDRELNRNVYADWLTDRDCYAYADLVRARGLDFGVLLELQERR